MIKEGCPFDHAALLKKAEALQKQFPFLDFRYLGNSILGRGIPMLCVGRGRRGVLYVGAHHGMEWLTSLLLVRFTEELCALLDRNATAHGISLKLLLQTHKLYIVPMLNPDGVDYQIHGPDTEHPLFERVLAMNGGRTDFSKWQANARGVDLNHNYNAGFMEYKTWETEHHIPQGCPTRYAGIMPESEPEVASLCNFIRFHPEICGVMTLHTQGEEIYFGSDLESQPRVRQIAKRLSAMTGYRMAVASGPAAFGGLTDWCVSELSLPAFTLECGRGENPLPYEQLFSIYPKLRPALFGFPSLL